VKEEKGGRKEKREKEVYLPLFPIYCSPSQKEKGEGEKKRKEGKGFLRIFSSAALTVSDERPQYWGGRGRRRRRKKKKKETANCSFQFPKVWQ